MSEQEGLAFSFAGPPVVSSTGVIARLAYDEAVIYVLLETISPTVAVSTVPSPFGIHPIVQFNQFDQFDLNDGPTSYPEVSCVWNLTGTHLYVAVAKHDTLYALRVDSPADLVQKQKHIPCHTQPLRLNSMRLSDGGDFLLIPSFGYDPFQVAVFRTTDLQLEAILQAPVDCTFQGRNMVKFLRCFHWDAFERHEHSRVIACDDNRSMSVRPHASSVPKRPRLGANAAFCYFDHAAKICDFGNGMRLYAYDCHDSRCIRQTELVWHNIEQRWWHSFNFKWNTNHCVCAPDKHVVYARAPVFTFDGRWVALAGCCSQFRILDTALLYKCRNMTKARSRRKVFLAAWSDVQFPGSYRNFYPVRVGYDGNDFQTAPFPRLFFEKVKEKAGQSLSSDWLVDVFDGRMIPTVQSSYLKTRSMVTLPTVFEHVALIGLRGVTLEVDLNMSFAICPSFMPSNRKVLQQWLYSIAHEVQQQAVNSPEVCSKKFQKQTKESDIARMGTSWFDVLSHKAPDAIDSIGWHLDAVSRSLLVIAYPQMLGRVYPKRAYAHALLVSWSSSGLPWRLDDSQKSKLWWANGDLSDFGFVWMQALTFGLDPDVLRMVVDRYSRSVVFLGDDSVAELFRRLLKAVSALTITR